MPTGRRHQRKISLKKKALHFGTEPRDDERKEEWTGHNGILHNGSCPLGGYRGKKSQTVSGKKKNIGKWILEELAKDQNKLDLSKKKHTKKVRGLLRKIRI